MNRKHLKTVLVIIIAIFAGIGGIAIPTLLHPGEGAEASVAQFPEVQANQTNRVVDDLSDQHIVQSTDSNSVFPKNQLSTENMSNNGTGNGLDSAENKTAPLSIAVTETINQDWIEERIEQYKDQIADEDLEDFRYIIGKLDMNYVNEIIEGRHGSDIDPILKEYLHSKLTSPEYNRARELFYAYSHLLF